MSKRYETVSDYGERSIISKFIKSMESVSEALPLDDDCQFLKIGDGAIISTDRTPSNLRYFEFGFMNYREYGRYHVYSNISDVISSGGVPKYYLLNLALQKSLSISDLEEFLVGVDEELSKFKVALVGGDTKEGSELNAVGIVIAEPYKRNTYINRSGAKAGDFLFIQRKEYGLGLTPASQEIFKMHSHRKTDLKLEESFEACLVRRDVSTMGPCLEAMKSILDQEIISACADNSDGVYATCAEIAKASRLDLMIDLESNFIDEYVHEYSSRHSLNAKLLALGAGGDFRLVLTGSEELKSNKHLICIGRAVSSGQVEGQAKVVGTSETPSVWNHFKTC